MQAISSIRHKGNLFTEIISLQTLTSISKSSGFSKRKSRKISALQILLSYMDFINSSTFSFHNWSIQLSKFTDQKISKQGIHKRINETFVQFAEGVLSHILQNQFAKYVDKDFKLFKAFGNVYLQDATHFSLPLHLAKLFPGNNTHGATRAVAKIVTIFNLKKGCFSLFNLTNFSESDSSSARLIYDKLKPGDLIIRDLGYFVVKVFEELIGKEVFFLSRLKHLVVISDIHTGNQIDLARYLRKNKSMDMQVLLSSGNPIPVRILAQSLPRHIADERRRKAKMDKRNKKTNHSKEYYYLLGYAIYITNVDQSTWTAKDICNAYKCRWSIEILFKSWKSNLRAHYTAPDRYASEVSVKIHFYLLLIYVSAFIMPMMIRIENKLIQARQDVQISIIKLTNYLSANLFEIICSNRTDKIMDQIVYYTKYDKRNDRLNAMKFIMLNP